MAKQTKQTPISTIILTFCAVFACASIIFLLSVIATGGHTQPEPTEPTESAQVEDQAIMESFDLIVSDALAQAYDAAFAVPKAYWINASTFPAPKPDPTCYGEADDPSTLAWLLEDAAELLNGQKTLFGSDIEPAPNSKVTYYLDNSILVITWQQVLNNYVYTFSEVKISHPSQFRRYLAENEFNSDYTHPVATMAETVNAVMASSADHYRGRNQGIVVYNGKVEQSNFADKIDTCFIDHNGDLLLVPAGTLEGHEEIQRFVDKNNIHTSIAFGPILIQDGKRCEPQEYYLGEIYGKYPRAALCQMDELHYVVVMANGRDGFWRTPDIHMFTDEIEKLGCNKAFTLDGGKTGTIVMRGKNLNPTVNGIRWVSDIIYFATAIPEPAESVG